MVDCLIYSLRFLLNGEPVFCKGANYIPCDCFLPRVTRETYERTIRDAVDVNMNMLRVWGGGIYEDDFFYELCDREGILIWQDFMYACAVYPAEGALLENMPVRFCPDCGRHRTCRIVQRFSAVLLWKYRFQYCVLQIPSSLLRLQR